MRVICPPFRSPPFPLTISFLLSTTVFVTISLQKTHPAAIEPRGFFLVYHMLKAAAGMAGAALVGGALYYSYCQGNEHLVQVEMKKLMEEQGKQGK